MSRKKEQIRKGGRWNIYTSKNKAFTRELNFLDTIDSLTDEEEAYSLRYISYIRMHQIWIALRMSGQDSCPLPDEFITVSFSDLDGLFTLCETARVFEAVLDNFVENLNPEEYSGIIAIIRVRRG